MLQNMKKFSIKYNKNIIFFCPSIEEGGVEKNLINICNGFQKKYKISLITANKNKKKFFKKKINFISPKTNFFNNKSRIVKSIYCIYLLLKNYNNKKNIIVSFQSNVLAIIMSKILNYKVIIRSNQSPNNYAKNIIKRSFMSFFYKKADKIIVNSNDFKNEFKKFFNLQSVSIYNLIETTSNLKKLSKKPIYNNFFSNSKKIINILSVGRLVPQKSQITILKALNIIKNRKKFKFYLIGKGSEYYHLQKFINENKLNNHIKILNFKDNIYPYYKKADVFVLSSLYEGLPNTLIEANYFNLTIISSDCKTGPKEILESNKSAKFFKVGNYKELSNIILSIKIKKKKKYNIDKKFEFYNNLFHYKKLILSMAK